MDKLISQIIVPSGVDYESRPLVAVYACMIPVGVDMKLLVERIVFLINTPDVQSDVDSVCSLYSILSQQDYGLILFSSPCLNRPPWSLLLKAYRQLGRPVRKNLKALTVIHPATWFRWVMDGAKLVVSPKFAKKLQYCRTLQELNQLQIVRLAQLSVSQDILEFDKTVIVKEKNSATSFQQQVVQKKVVFGAPVPPNCSSLPAPISDAMQHLIQGDGLCEEGIFRRSPSSVTLKEVKQLYENGATSVNFSQYPQSTYLAAALIKVYLREMPWPVFDQSTYPIIRQYTAGSQVVNVLSQIHPTHLHLLTIIVAMLNYIQKSPQVEQSKMTASNLALVFAPNLVRVDSNPMQEMDLARSVSLVLTTFISNYDRISVPGVDKQLLKKQFQQLGCNYTVN